VKRIGNLWPRVVAFDNLLLAFRKARTGKRGKSSVAEFELGLESELLRLQRDLLAREYTPGAYRLFTVYEGKPRLIAAAPFLDRVAHHAVMNVLEPLLDRRFIADSYACRVGKGVHRAVARYQDWSQRYRYALKMDVQRYFPSIDRGLMKEKLHRVIKDDGDAKGGVQFSAFHPSVRSWIGHARHADTQSLREKLFSEIVFRGGPAGRPPGVARGVVEQQTREGAFRQP
jgi:hypothetical protein